MLTATSVISLRGLCLTRFSAEEARSSSLKVCRVEQDALLNRGDRSFVERCEDT